MTNTSDTLKEDIKQAIVRSLRLPITAAEIGDDTPLFGEGLGLDSIDALELGVAIRKTYGLTIGAVSEEVRQHFATVASLAAFIHSSTRAAA